MATERGNATNTVIYEEAVYGVAPTTPNGLKLTLTQNGVQMKRGMNNNDDILNGDRNSSKGSLGRKDILGTFVSKAGSRESAFLMKHTLGGGFTYQGVASVTIGGSGGTGYTNGAPATFSASPVGDTATGTLIVSGGVITGVTITNPGKYLIGTPPTATAPTGTGATLTPVLGGLDTQIIKVGALPPGLTMDKQFATLGTVERYLGCRINMFKFSLTDDGVLMPSYDLIGSDEIDDTALLDVTPKFYQVAPWAQPKAIVTEGGSPMKIASNIQLTILNNLDNGSGRTVGNNGAISDCPEGKMKVDFTMTVLFQSKALLDKAKNETVSNFALLFTQGTHSWRLDMNEINYDVSEPQINNPNAIQLPMHGYAFLDADAAASQIISTHVNDVATIATFPS